MEMDWDEHNWLKCAKHGVEKADIEYVLLHAKIIIPDLKKDYGEIRYDAIGKNERGRYIFVAFCYRKDKMRPISARYMHKSEIAYYFN